MAEGLDQAGQLVSEVVPRRDLRNLRADIIDAAQMLIDLRVVCWCIPSEDRHSPDGLLHEVEQHVAEAGIGVCVSATPHRRQGMRGPRKKKVVDVRDARVFHPGTLVRHVHWWDQIGRHLPRQGQSVDPIEGRHVRSVRLFSVGCTIERVNNHRGLTSRHADHRVDGRIESRLVQPFQPSLGQFAAALRTRKHVPHAPAGLVQRLLGKHDLTRAIGTTEHLAPDGVVDPPRGLAVGVQGLIHPAELCLDLVE